MWLWYSTIQRRMFAEGCALCESLGSGYKQAGKSQSHLLVWVKCWDSLLMAGITSCQTLPARLTLRCWQGGVIVINGTPLHNPWSSWISEKACRVRKYLLVSEDPASHHFSLKTGISEEKKEKLKVKGDWKKEEIETEISCKFQTKPITHRIECYIWKIKKNNQRILEK